MKGWWLIRLYLAVVAAVLLLLVCGCRSVKYVPVETVRTETVLRTDTFIQKDSCVVRDSVFIHAKGDTVWYEKWHTRYVDRWRERLVTDSFIKRDSVPVPYPVERELSKWERFCLDYGKVTTGVSLAAVMWAAAWIVRRARRRL